MEAGNSEKILLIGAGALARDIISVIGRDCFAGTYIDPGFPLTPVDGLPVFTDWSEAARNASRYLLAVLDREHRLKACSDARKAGLLPCSPLVHQTAQVAAGARIAPGCLVGYHSVISPAAELEENVMVMFSAQISHDSVIGSNSVILHGACISGYVRIGKGCFVGANAVVAPGVTIGDGSFIAAGAVCFKDAPAGSMLLGNPARITALGRAEE